jgi:uncharacterized protein YkwD
LPPHRARLGAELLEARDCPATATLFNGVLTVLGTDGDDRIRVARDGDRISAAGQWFLNGEVAGIVITAGGGNDVVRDDSGRSTVIFGGVGNDRIFAAAGHDTVFGGHGDDTISGDRGADIIWGGTGTDTIDAGLGANTVIYGSTDRVLENAEIELEIVRRVNSYRRANGLSRLAVNPRLNAAADLHSLDMMEITGRFGPLAAIQHQLHGTTRPQISDRLDAVGYDDWTRVFRYGENIALGYATAERVVAAWISSPAHRANILDPGFTETGVSVRADALGQLFFTQDFGRLA